MRSQGCHADPTLPSVLSDRPARQPSPSKPPPRRPTLIRAVLVLRDQALVPALDHLLPRLQAVRGEPAHREDQLAPGDDVFQSGAAITEREFRADR